MKANKYNSLIEERTNRTQAERLVVQSNSLFKRIFVEGLSKERSSEAYEQLYHPL